MWELRIKPWISIDSLLTSSSSLRRKQQLRRNEFHESDGWSLAMNWDTESTSPQNAVASDPLTDKQRSESENSRFRSIYSPPPPRLRKNRGKKEERKKVGDVRKSKRRYESFFYIPVVRVQSPSTPPAFTIYILFRNCGTIWTVGG